MPQQSVIFHLHGRDPTTAGIVVNVDPTQSLDQIKNTVGTKLDILDPKGNYSFMHTGRC